MYGSALGTFAWSLIFSAVTYKAMEAYDSESAFKELSAIGLFVAMNHRPILDYGLKPIFNYGIKPLFTYVISPVVLGVYRPTLKLVTEYIFPTLGAKSLTCLSHGTFASLALTTIFLVAPILIIASCVMMTDDINKWKLDVKCLEIINKQTQDGVSPLARPYFEIRKMVSKNSISIAEFQRDIFKSEYSFTPANELRYQKINDFRNLVHNNKTHKEGKLSNRSYDATALIYGAGLTSLAAFLLPIPYAVLLTITSTLLYSGACIAKGDFVKLCKTELAKTMLNLDTNLSRERS